MMIGGSLGGGGGLHQQQLRSQYPGLATHDNLEIGRVGEIREVWGAHLEQRVVRVLAWLVAIGVSGSHFEWERDVNPAQLNQGICGTEAIAFVWLRLSPSQRHVRARMWSRGFLSDGVS